MEKYGVVTENNTDKTAGVGLTCPKCGAEVPDQSPLICPNCGSEPFEVKNGEKEKEAD